MPLMPFEVTFTEPLLLHDYNGNINIVSTLSGSGPWFALWKHLTLSLTSL